MINPEQVVEILRTVTLPLPTSTVNATPTSIKPIPTVIPTPPEFQHAHKAGFTTLWVVFVLMVLASAFFTLLAWRVPVNKRLYHVVTTLITITAALSYFAMATGNGTTFHCAMGRDSHDKVPDTHHVVCRQVFWARYVDWAITTPLLILDLAMLAGIDGAHTLMAVAADLVMVLTGLFAAFGDGHGRGHGRAAGHFAGRKWGWYTIAIIAYLVVIWHVGLHGSRMVRAKGRSVVRLFGGLAGFTLVVWTAYPIVWGIADGARNVAVDSEIIAYAVLDVLAKGVFGVWLLLAHRRVPEANVELGGWWSHGFASEGRIRIGDDDEA